MPSWVYQQGFEKGLEMALEKGRFEEARSTLLRILAMRNLTLTEEDRARIEACADLSTLHRWLDEAVDATSAADALK
jgi:hypothetical protein